MFCGTACKFSAMEIYFVLAKVYNLVLIRMKSRHLYVSQELPDCTCILSCMIYHHSPHLRQRSCDYFMWWSCRVENLFVNYASLFVLLHHEPFLILFYFIFGFPEWKEGVVWAIKHFLLFFWYVKMNLSKVTKGVLPQYKNGCSIEQKSTKSTTSNRLYVSYLVWQCQPSITCYVTGLLFHLKHPTIPFPSQKKGKKKLRWMSLTTTYYLHRSKYQPPFSMLPLRS